ADVFRSLEHHVFEQVREAGATLALIARADLVANGDRVYGRVMILSDDHAEAVIERRIRELDLRKFGLSRAGQSESESNERERLQEVLKLEILAWGGLSRPPPPLQGGARWA